MIDAKRNKENIELINSFIIYMKENYGIDYLNDPKPCPVCERFIINARIKEVYVRITKDTYKVLKTKDFIDYDTSF